MPADGDGAQGAVDFGGARGHDVGLRPEAGGLAEIETAFDGLFFAEGSRLVRVGRCYRSEKVED